MTHLSRPIGASPFHLLSFEGPDSYARAGGVSSRVTGLSHALVASGHPTSLWFVGDPNLPGHERRDGVMLHRWCQWISHYHSAGVYDGEQSKAQDYAVSLPPRLLEVLRRDIAVHGHAVVLAEEWHTAGAVLHLDTLLRQAQLRAHVTMLWNANNIFGFDSLDWGRLAQAAYVSTVSRYMRALMLDRGVDPLVIHNGLGRDAFFLPSEQAVRGIQERCDNRLLLTKIARWDPDKRWLLAVRTVALLKQIGARPLLVARGGIEAHEQEVLATARSAGLRIQDCVLETPSETSLVEALSRRADADMLIVRSHIGPATRSALFRASNAVLVNSSHEPFGLVGLEAMAVGGIACTGNTGEDYAFAGKNGLVLQQDDPAEFVNLYLALCQRPDGEQRMRFAAMQTAADFAWDEIVRDQLLPYTCAASTPVWPAQTAERRAPQSANRVARRLPQESFATLSSLNAAGAPLEPAQRVDELVAL